MIDQKAIDAELAEMFRSFAASVMEKFPGVVSAALVVDKVGPEVPAIAAYRTEPPDYNAALSLCTKVVRSPLGLLKVVHFGAGESEPEASPAQGERCDDPEEGSAS